MLYCNMTEEQRKEDYEKFLVRLLKRKEQQRKAYLKRKDEKQFIKDMERKYLNDSTIRDI